MGSWNSNYIERQWPDSTSGIGLAHTHFGMMSRLGGDLGGWRLDLSPVTAMSGGDE